MSWRSPSADGSANYSNKLTLFQQIPEYTHIISDLSRGHLKSDFCSANGRRSKLCHSLDEILFDERNDELSYFVLFMERSGLSAYVKFLLDLNGFGHALADNRRNIQRACVTCSNVLLDETQPNKESNAPLCLGCLQNHNEGTF